MLNVMKLLQYFFGLGHCAFVLISDQSAIM